MATYLMDVKIGGRTYYINHNGEDVYYSTSTKTSGSSKIKGLKFKNNQILKDGKPATEFQIAQAMGK